MRKSHASLALYLIRKAPSDPIAMAALVWTGLFGVMTVVLEMMPR